MSIKIIIERFLKVSPSQQPDRAIKINVSNSKRFILLFAFVLLFAIGCSSGGSDSGAQQNVSNIDPSQVSVNFSWQDGANGSEAPSGYYIYYGRESGNLINSIDVGYTNNVTLSGNDFEFSGLGKYYFHIVAYSQSMMFSAPSTEQMIEIR